MVAQTSEAVFVYGTFRPPQAWTPPADSRFYPRISGCILSALPAVLEGADLFDLGQFPAARPGSGVVIGELLRMAPEALPLMDEIEGHPEFFRRARVRVATAQAPCLAWIYWAPARLVQQAAPLPGGDWFRRKYCR